EEVVLPRGDGGGEPNQLGNRVIGNESVPPQQPPVRVGSVDAGVVDPDQVLFRGPGEGESPSRASLPVSARTASTILRQPRSVRRSERRVRSRRARQPGRLWGPGGSVVPGCVGA